jgi:hypothetical protein
MHAYIYNSDSPLFNGHRVLILGVRGEAEEKAVKDLVSQKIYIH